MESKRRNWYLLVLTLLLVLMAIVSESLYFTDFEYHFRTRRFNRILHEKEKIMDDCLKGLEPIIARGEPHGSVSENNLFTIAEQNEITILEYMDNKLTYWSDNAFDVPLILEDSTYSKPFIFMQNGWFLPKTIKASNEVIVGLLRVRTDHGFENEIIRNGFEKDFRISDDVRFSPIRDGSEYIVSNSEGTFLFSLSFPEIKSNTILILIPLIFWALVFVIIIFLSNEAVKRLASRGKTNIGLYLCILTFGLLYASLLFLTRPEVIFRTGLFSSYIFSLNGFIPSLGHMVLLSILAADFSFILYRYLPVGSFEKGSKRQGYFIIAILLILSLFLICLVHILFRHLVTDSNFSFEAYKVLDLSFFSIAGFTSVILLFLVPLFLILKANQIRQQLRRGSDTIQDTGKNKKMLFNLTVAFSIIFGLYSLSMIIIYSGKKTTEHMKIQALSFSTENDPEAEHLLLDIWPEMMKDSILRKMMDVEYFQNDFVSISNHLRETYFGGYWGNYNYTISLCRSDDPLEIGQSGEVVENCFSFFNERIRKYGHRLTGTGFYFIDNQGGRSYYQGQLLFKESPTITHGLFIELYNDVNVFQPGYTELLLDKKFRGYSGLKDYSFAKYINGEIVLKSGEFPYSKADDEYIDKNTDYRIFNDGKFKHILYKNGNATVIISRPELNAGDILITFAYLFAFTFLFTNLLVLLIRKPGVHGIVNLNFRQKLQFSFIGILLFSFILIGIVISFLTIREYKSKHYENITEKLNSIYLELDTKLAAEKNLTADWRNSTNSSLNELLVNLSNIFNTDINLYNLNGFLMATSREEIFYRDLTGRRMNNMALINLKDLTKSLYSQTETIGRLKYISVYVPFYNIDNNVLAYLNLPYFRMQSLLAREISNLIVAVINFTLLLVLITMGLAVFISRRLTSPLSMLSDGLASVELGKKSEHLSYSGSDEIGELVRQYNRMVDELDDSALKLADSEREYAWREMAKQIAHEIKNPLTPMKLNVQQLLKSWKDDIPGFEEKLEGFSKNQIEYIDNLSSIASAFSTFAKMPGTNPMEVNLLEQIKTTLELFKNTDNMTFQVQWPVESKVFIFADREHLNGIFSNLFKNSIQSIPPDRKGLVKVSMEVVHNKVIISVHDNGSGIPDSLQKKMFTPNFTTKSSGTGLGLSIVKKYVEGANGRVWFESAADKGTVFHLEFPLMYTVERPGEIHRK
jgi:two-component system, NtrC family, nitrogen regulation sensor histidine kinase NtrY